MDSNELTGVLEGQAREHGAEGELAVPAESGGTALALDGLDGAAGGRVTMVCALGV